MGDNIRIRCTSYTQAEDLIKRRLMGVLKICFERGEVMWIECKKDTRTLSQNARLWAMLSDISKQVVWHGRKLSGEDWKHVFSAAVSKQDVAPGIDSGFVVLGKSTSKMTRKEMGEMQTIMEAFGAEQGVKFTCPEQGY